MNDNELLPPEWGEVWRTAESPQAADVVRDVRRRTRRQAIRTILELMLAVAAAAALVLLAHFNAHPADRPFAVLYATAVLAFAVHAILNARGTWQPHGESPADYARLQVLRAERRIRAVRAGFGFLVLSSVLYVPWILGRTPSPGARTIGLLYLAALVSVYVFVLRRGLLRARIDLDLWRKAADQLTDSD